MKQEKMGRVGFFYGLIVLTAFLAYIVTYNQKNRELTAEERTEQRALLVGRQLIDNHFEQKIFLQDSDIKAVESRGLASSSSETPFVMKKNLNGEVGRDAWGQPFYFQVKGDGISNSTLYIWSLGPNEKPEFKDFKDLLAQGARGDDILVTIPF